ncbi:MAG TPA: wax ester/triacylglycerol synthase family O-acyltransferase [Mycobacteriales bacterium]|nr:wax ester/triacylglycerol synthase family O-acyltransferase [Mycobacteriales bacterium]
MRQLSGVDALHVLEETGDQHMHTIKIAIVAPHEVGRPVSVDEVRTWARERLILVPPLRWTVHKIPLGLGRPVFRDAGPIDVDRHVRAERLASGTDEELDEVVSRIASTQLPRDRPLWELTVVEGLPGERVALVFKIHHSIMDGQASVRFFEVAFDGGDLDVYGPVPAAPEPQPTSPQLVGFALKSQASLWALLPKVTARTVRSIRDNRARKKGGAPPVVNPMSGPATRFNKLPLAERVYADVTIPFSEIKAVKDATGRTVNEVFVTLCGGAIRRYLEEKGESPDRCLNCAHPISLRADHERDNWGNRTSYWYVSLATDIADPLERLAAVKESIDAAREWAKGDVELFAVWQDYYLLFGKMTLGMLSLAEKMSGRPAFNAVVSNVKGPPPLTFNGADVIAVRSMGPITRVLGLNLTAWSYRDDFSIGLQSCTEFMPDLRRLGDHLRDELAAMKAAASAASSAASA